MLEALCAPDGSKEKEVEMRVSSKLLKALDELDDTLRRPPLFIKAIKVALLNRGGNKMKLLDGLKKRFGLSFHRSASNNRSLYAPDGSKEKTKERECAMRESGYCLKIRTADNGPFAGWGTKLILVRPDGSEVKLEDVMRVDIKICPQEVIKATIVMLPHQIDVIAELEAVGLVSELKGAR